MNKIHLADVRRNIRLGKKPPYLVVIVGPCRVGTTALSNTFARSGITSYMQPIKSLRRALEDGSAVTPWEIGDDLFALTKETLGPDLPSEFFDPLDVLLALDYPKPKIHLIPIVRLPQPTLASWIRLYGEDRVTITHFRTAYKMTHRIKERALKQGIAVTPYVHEALRDNPSEKVIARIFRRLNIASSFSPQTVSWIEGDNFQQDDDVVFFDSPPFRFIEGVQTWGGYRYREEADLNLTTRRQEELFHSPELNDLYEEFRRECEQTLGLPIKQT
jgi:hypothetical protein